MDMVMEFSWVREFVFGVQSLSPVRSSGSKESLASGLTKAEAKVPSSLTSVPSSAHVSLLLPVQNGNKQVLGAWGVTGEGLGKSNRGSKWIDTHSRTYPKGPLASAKPVLHLSLPTRPCRSHQLWTRKGRRHRCIGQMLDRDQRKVFRGGVTPFVSIGYRNGLGTRAFQGKGPQPGKGHRKGKKAPQAQMVLGRGGQRGSPMLCSSYLRPGQLLKPGEALSVPLSDSLVITTPSGSPVLIACFPPRVHAREQAGGLYR